MSTVFAVDIGGTQVKAARVDENGTIFDSRKVPTPAGLDEFLRMAEHLVTDFGSGCSAVGVGCKGIIDARTTRVEVLPGTVHFLEGHLLSRVFGVGEAPVFADNDARVALLGERRWGAARGRQDVVLLTLGTGVGGGVLSGGQLVRGMIGAGGHLGHYTVEVDGVECICGNKGCLETVFSSKAIEAAAKSAIDRGVASALLECGDRVTCADVFRLGEGRDRVAAGIVSRAVRALAAAVAGLVFVFDPEVVVVGGQIADAGEYLLRPLREQVWERTRHLLRREVEVVRAQLADRSGVLGAAALALDGAAI